MYVIIQNGKGLDPHQLSCTDGIAEQQQQKQQKSIKLFHPFNSSRFVMFILEIEKGLGESGTCNLLYTSLLYLPYPTSLTYLLTYCLPVSSNI